MGDSGKMVDTNWSLPGATISDKTARDDYGLAQAEIVQAIRDGKLQYREMSMHGNPWLRLLRAEVELLVLETHGPGFLKSRLLKCDLADVESKLRKAKAQMTSLTKKRVDILAALENVDIDKT